MDNGVLDFIDALARQRRPDASRAAGTVPAAKVERQAFQARLVAALGDAAALAVGKIHFLNLADLQAEFGAHWDRVAGKCHEVVEAVVQDHLQPGDFHTRYRDDVYVLVFKDLSADAAGERVAAITLRIRELLREWDLRFAALGIAGAAAAADPRLLRETPDPLAALATELDQPQHQLPPRRGAGPQWQPIEIASRPAPGIAPPAPPQPSQPTLAPAAQPGAGDWVAGLAATERRLAEAQGRLHAQPVPAAEHAARTATSGPKTEIRWESFHVGKPNAPPNEIVAELRAAGWDFQFESEFRCAYMPIWNRAASAVTAYHSDAGLEVESAVYPIDAVVPDQLRTPVLAAVDRIVLRRAAADLEAALGRGSKCLVIVPVHYSTLRSADAWQRHLVLCNRLALPVRRCLVWEVVDAEVEPKLSQLSVDIAAIRTFGRSVSLRWTVDQPLLRGLKGIGVNAVGINLARSTEAESKLFAGVTGFAERAAQEGLQVYAFGCKSLSIVAAAASSGFGYLTGPAIGGPSAAPDGVFRFEVMDLYRQQAAPPGAG